MMDDETILTLFDYVDGRLGTAERAALESRIADDAALRAELDAIRRLRAEIDALPRRLEPDRDLWPEIASRLEGNHRTAIDFSRFRSRERMRVSRYLVAAAALFLFALGTPYLMQSPPPVSPTTATGPVAAPTDPEFERVAAQYLAARDELLALLKERKDEIAPETYTVVEDNLAVIASAVTEIETALAAQPQSEKLERLLYAAYRSEVNLLQQAVQLTGMPEASNPVEADGGDNDAG